MKSANADIGAARVQLFPDDFADCQCRVGSDALSSLFSHGMQIWSFAPSVTLPLFTGGSNLAQLRYAEAQKRGLIATYEKTFRAHLKDVANALARRTTLEEQLDAQRQYVKAEQQTVDVGLRRYQAGVGDYLTVLTAQRSLRGAHSRSCWHCN
ncbi:TolC family protein [Escherichia coli]